MSPEMWLLILIGPWLFIGVVSIPAVLQWPRPVSMTGRPVFARTHTAGGWR